jgi:hypothetical protein
VPDEAVDLPLGPHLRGGDTTKEVKGGESGRGRGGGGGRRRKEELGRGAGCGSVGRERRLRKAATTHRAWLAALE